MARKSKGKKERQEAALERNEVAKERSPEEQLKKLDSRLGKDVGAAKERARLKKKVK